LETGATGVELIFELEGRGDDIDCGADGYDTAGGVVGIEGINGFATGAEGGGETGTLIAGGIVFGAGGSINFRYCSTPPFMVRRSRDALISISNADAPAPQGPIGVERIEVLGWSTRFQRPRRPIVLTNALESTLWRTGKGSASVCRTKGSSASLLGPGAWSVRCKMFKDESGSEAGRLGDRTVDPPAWPTVRWALAGSLGKPVVSSSDLASSGRKSKSRSDSSSGRRGFRMASAKLFPRT